MRLNVMRITLYHTLQLTSCCMQLVASSWDCLNFLVLYLHSCYMRKESAYSIKMLLCALCVQSASGFMEIIIETH